MSDMNMYKILGQFNNVDPKLTPVTEDDINEPVYESVDPKGSIIEAVKSLEEKYMGFKESKHCDVCDSAKCKCESVAEGKFDEPAEIDADAVAKRKRLQALKDKQEDERAEKDSDDKPASRFVPGKAYGGAAQKADKEDDDLEESAKPDFLDVDKDGDKKEPFKKAVKDKEQVEEGKPSLSDKVTGDLQKIAAKKDYKSKKDFTSADWDKVAKPHGFTGKEVAAVRGHKFKEGTNFGDTIKNSAGKMTKVTEGKDAIRNHPIYTTKEAWDHYAQELAEQETMDEAVLEPMVNVQQELDEIAALAGLTRESPEAMAPADSSSPLTHESALDEAATRKDFRQVADLIKQIPDADKRKELAHHHSDIFKQQNPRFKHDVFCKACGVDECDYSMGSQPAVIVGEEVTDEGNEFSGALAAAKASGEKEFEVDGKRYTVKEDINVNVSANGEEDVVNLIRKLSGMPVVAVQVPQQIESDAPCGICGATPCGCEQEVTEDGPKEREIEHVNTPREDQAGADASFPNGTDLNRAKKSYSDKPYRGDNPMAVKEAIQDMLWEKYETMINDVKA